MGEGPEHVERTGLVDAGQGQGAHSQGVPHGLGGATYIHQPHLDGTNGIADLRANSVHSTTLFLIYVCETLKSQIRARAFHVSSSGG